MENNFVAIKIVLIPHSSILPIPFWCIGPIRLRMKEYRPLNTGISSNALSHAKNLDNN